MPELTDDDRAVIVLARRTLAAEHGYDAESLAARCGALEYHVDALLRLAERLGGF